jgi:hypothetical protein
MRLTKYLGAFGATLLITVGCATVDITKTAKGFRNPTNPAEVMILKTRPEESYEELGVLTVTGFAPSETAKMHNAIRAKSAPLGADAVIITDEGIYTDPWAGPVKYASGVAIAYKKHGS